MNTQKHPNVMDPDNSLGNRVEVFVTELSEKDRCDLLTCLLMKRAYDGINGRIWDASQHLAWEIDVEGFNPPS